MMRFCDTAEKIKEMVEMNGVYKDKFKDYTNQMLTDREANNLQTTINAEKDEWWNK
jgi:hypothetical protein